MYINIQFFFNYQKKKKIQFFPTSNTWDLNQESKRSFPILEMMNIMNLKHSVLMFIGIGLVLPAPSVIGFSLLCQHGPHWKR